MEKVQFEEIFAHVISEFKAHLEDDRNEKIIFSGRYGVGKTSFLEDFFDLEQQKKQFKEEKYKVYRLSPVNYSISATEDILEYIKYDIILEFLRKGYSFEKKDLGFLKTLPGFLKKNLHKVAAALVYIIPEVGKDVVETFERLDGLKEAFLEAHEEAAKAKDDLLFEYLDAMERKVGGIYANDVVTQLIKEVVTRQGKNPMLVIDDLDRLDPEHIFRILNVFSAHFDHPAVEGVANKLGFKKIILVCDYNNIKHVFAHRYGAEVDFTGYIDKFYSTDVFYFDSRQSVSLIIESVLQSFLYKVGEREKDIARQVVEANEFLPKILVAFVEMGFVRLRTVVQLYGRTFNLHFRPLLFQKSFTAIKAFQLPVVIQLKLLRNFLGDSDTLERRCEECKMKNIRFDWFDDVFGQLFMLATFGNTDYFAPGSKSPYKAYFQSRPYAVYFKLAGNKSVATVVVIHIIDDGEQDEREGENVSVTPQLFWDTMLAGIGELKRISMIE